MTLIFYATGQDKENSGKYKLGEYFGGGIIFYLDQTGDHGLIASPVDQADYARWGNIGFINAMLMNEGDTNTKRIVRANKNQNPGNWSLYCAACICDSLNYQGFHDWYLPSINELKEMYNNQKMIGNFVALDYCSSTEKDYKNCWAIHFMPTSTTVFSNVFSKRKNYPYFTVRCIRKF